MNNAKSVPPSMETIMEDTKLGSIIIKVVTKAVDIQVEGSIVEVVNVVNSKTEEVAAVVGDDRVDDTFLLPVKS
jgi:hypothetical protein